MCDGGEGRFPRFDNVDDGVMKESIFRLHTGDCPTSIISNVMIFRILVFVCVPKQSQSMSKCSGNLKKHFEWIKRWFEVFGNFG